MPDVSEKTNIGRRWTDEDIEMLLSLRDRGWNHASIAHAMGRSKQAVAYQLKIRQPYDPKTGSGSQLCAYCINAVPDPEHGYGCNWSRHFKPVPGWTAKPSKVKFDAGRDVMSYAITACPEFKEG